MVTVKVVIATFTTIYLCAICAFGHIFLTKTIPIVGWDYIASNWGTYLAIVVFGHCVFLMFFGMALLAALLGEI